MKLAVQNSLSYCVKENKACIFWADKYFKDCLCNFRDELSFAFGLISLVLWGVAEIPQIITNFKTKSAHGVSLIFLITWVVGDVFNLVGCVLEPATLPTQFYTAVLYTATTLVLVLQSIYYDYFHQCQNAQEKESNQEVDDVNKPLLLPNSADSAIPIPNGIPRATPDREVYYYMSARSMAGSMTPPMRSSFWPVKSGPAAVGIDNDSSSDDEEANPIPAKNSVSNPRPIPRSVGFGAFLTAAMNMPTQTKALMQVSAGLTARKLLQEHGDSQGEFGQWLGWMMAAIYMGGRLPQIWLNIKRGNVEGLNPLMFIFALTANATYVASILVRSVEWEKIKANMPWLLDAVGCVALDLFIILQYVYYRYYRKGSGSSDEKKMEDTLR